MSRPSARRARRPHHGALAAAVVAVVLALASTACSSSEEKAAPPPAPTPIGGLNVSSMQVPRIEFCQLVPDDAVEAALYGNPESDTAYGNGDETALTGAGTDVVHELGCSWGTGTDEGTTARAWVFARPVDARFAKTLVDSAEAEKGCRTEPGPSFGTPSVMQTCRLPTGDLRVRHAGLFGQTWLTCEVSEATQDNADLTGRADDWCVSVVNALNTGR